MTLFPRHGQVRQHDVSAMIDALMEPAALCGADGVILTANPPWRDQVGAGRRLPKGGAGLFRALLAARKAGRGQGAVMCGQTDRAAEVAALDPDRFLVRLLDGAAPPLAPQPPSPLIVTGGALDAFAAASPFGAVLIDGIEPFDGPIRQANSAMTSMAGAAPLAGTTLCALLSPRSADEARASQAAGRPGPFEVSLAAGPEKTAHLYLSPAGERWVAYLLDVTDQKQMQRQLAQRNKMEAVGQLAGGVAHDFNNLLSAISLRADELLLRHSLGDPSYESLAEIRETVVRAADVVRQLLTFSRKATIQRETLDLGEMLSNFEVLLRRLLREDVRLATDYGRNLPLVRADKAQLENAVMNLVVNARDAVQAQGGGTVRLRTARLTIDEALALGCPAAEPGEMALIEVADDGPGIAPDVIANVFEPFFTTKPLGEGTGLGLATVYGIVKQSEGQITVVSTPGEGAIFRIFLPVHVPPLTVEQPAAQPRAIARDLSGVGRILFVEDEALVRGIAARLLRARGYEVIEAEDGEDALILAEEYSGRIDLMISDVIMPGMDGPSLLRAARPFLGAAPVMFISGYAEAEFSDLLEGETGVSFLAKPLDIMTLAERVKQALRGM